MKQFEGATPAMSGGEDPAAAASGVLAPGERLLFAALRGWAALRAEGERPHEQIVPLLAHKTSNRAASLFVAWIQAVEAASVRPLEIECPGCGGPAADAQRLIVACGIASAAPRTAETVLAPLLLEPGAVVVLGRSLNAALTADGWPLPVRLGGPRPAGHAEGPRTLH